MEPEPRAGPSGEQPTTSRLETVRTPGSPGAGYSNAVPRYHAWVPPSGYAAQMPVPGPFPATSGVGFPFASPMIRPFATQPVARPRARYLRPPLIAPVPAAAQPQQVAQIMAPPASPPPPPPQADGTVRCSVCQRFGGTPEAVSRHLFLHILSIKECEFCRLTFWYSVDYDIHMATHRGNPNLARLRNRRRSVRYMCIVCNTTYPEEQALDQHMNTHRENASWNCTVCNAMRFFTFDDFMEHSRLHALATSVSLEGKDLVLNCLKCLPTLPPLSLPVRHAPGKKRKSK